MEYPKYMDKPRKPYFKWVLILNILSVSLCFLVPWYIYIQGSLLFLQFSYLILKKFKGYKAVCAITFALMLMMLQFDAINLDLSWSIDYVIPSLFMFLVTLKFIIVMVKKHKWAHYDQIHILFIAFSIVMAILMIVGLIEAIIMGSITLAIFAASLVAIWIRVGRKYYRSLLKFIHV